jgi:N6-adenosine-specific RNA methylase IME4
VYADPPWRYEHSKTDNRKIENQYPTMELGEICRLPVQGICEDDCTLFLWATSPKLAESLEVLAAWGFKYRTCMVWVKDKIGMGYYARQQHELLLIATRGNPGTPAPPNRPSSVVNAPRTKHSKKPVEFYAAIEKMYPKASKVELFCRQPRDGWQVWGNQV